MKSPMKKILAVAMTAIGCATVASAAGVANSISGIHSVKTHYPWNGKVDICYTSIDSTGKGQILLDVGPTKRCITLEGADITVGMHTKTFDLHEMCGEFKSEVLASVSWERSQLPDDATGAETGVLGDLMAVDAADPGKFVVNVYTNVDLGKFNCDAYKKYKLALLKIPAGCYWPARPGSGASETIATTIAPTKEYWIGLFPVTSCQYDRIAWTGDSSTTIYPKTCSYDLIRSGSDSTISNPTDKPADGTFMGNLTLKSSGYLKGKFDLPTEMQWELAARAGSTSPYGHYVQNGAAKIGTADNLTDYAWYIMNTQVPEYVMIQPNVGLKCPNLWGLYDMMGLVAEWCLDQYEDAVEWKDVETPYYAGPSKKRVIHSGYYKSTADEVRLSHRAGRDADDTGTVSYQYAGFRVCFMPEP